MRKIKNFYQRPLIETLEVSVEAGIALTYGQEGNPAPVENDPYEVDF